MYYSKIETPFERDMDGSRRLIPGKYRNPAVRAVRDLPWEWTLKVDGTSVLIAGLYAGDLPPAASIAAVAIGLACLVAAAVVGSAAGKPRHGL